MCRGIPSAVQLLLVESMKQHYGSGTERALRQSMQPKGEGLQKARQHKKRAALQVGE
jgi:hypothetical protein